MKGKNVDWYEIANKANKALIIAHGYIGPYDSISSKQFIKDFNALAEKNTEIDIDLNSGGGSVFDGNVIYNTVKGSKATVNITVSGIAASMGSILLQAATGKRRAYKNARIMVHKPSGSAYGSSKKIRDTADQLDSIEDSLVEIYVEATGQDETTVKAWLQEGVDKWFSAKQALDAGLIDEIIDGPPVKAPKASLDPEAMHQHFSTQFKSIYNSTEESMNKAAVVAMLATYGCVASAEASDNELLDKFKNVISDRDNTIADLKAKLQAQNDERITALVDGAVASGKILAGQKEQYVKLAKLDFESTAGIINNLSPKASLLDAADRGKSADGKETGADATRADWSFNKWRKEDPRGLEKMRTSNPADYEALKAKQVSTLNSK